MAKTQTPRPQLTTVELPIKHGHGFGREGCPKCDAYRKQNAANLGMPTMADGDELTEQYIEAVKRALADASVPVYYDEATLPDYVDLFLTPLESVLDERNATVLGWREETRGWRVVDFTDGEITDGFTLDLPLFADPAAVAREVAAWLGVDETPASAR